MREMLNSSCGWLFKFERINTGITKTGTYFAVLTLLVGVAAVNTGNNLLYVVLSMMLSVMAISGFESLINIKGLEPEIIVPDEIYAKTRSTLKVRIKNIKPFPSFLVRCVFPDYKGVIEKATVFMVRGGNEKTAMCAALFPRRGIYKIEQLILLTTFPFGFTYRWKTFSVELEFIVYPHIRKVALKASGDEEEVGETEGIRREGVGGDFIGLREYTPRDKLSLVHWKAYARTGKLFVKQFADREGKRVMIVLSDDAGDAEVEEAASLAVSHLKAGDLVGVTLGSKLKIDYGTGDSHRRKILRELALFNL